METFLELNGLFIKYEIDEIVKMVLAVELDAWKVDEIENWLRERVKNYSVKGKSENLFV